MRDGRISNWMQIASLRRYTLTEGAEKGLDVIDCANGNIRFLVNVSKACDIMQTYYRGENVSFVSKNGFTARETPFLKRFEGGMLYTCGLDSLDEREGFETHGGFHNTPASIKSVSCDEKGIMIEAQIVFTELCGRNLVVRRRITSALNSDSVSVEDTLLNAGYTAEQYCLLYHINIGYPLLDEGGRIIADLRAYEPRTDWATKNIEKAFLIENPVSQAEETCYYLYLNKPEISYINEKTGKKLTLTYSGETLHHFVEWKNMLCGDYALGIEPCTTEFDDRFKYSVLEPNEKAHFRVELRIEQVLER